MARMSPKELVNFCREAYTATKLHPRKGSASIVNNETCPIGAVAHFLHPRIRIDKNFENKAYIIFQKYFELTNDELSDIWRGFDYDSSWEDSQNDRKYHKAFQNYRKELEEKLEKDL